MSETIVLGLFFAFTFGFIWGLFSPGGGDDDDNDRGFFIWIDGSE